jgi:hypothetical protein
LQKPFVPTDGFLPRYTAGNPIYFSLDGTHGHKYTLWSFPDPDKYTIPHTLDNETLRKVRGRFALVREDLQDELVRQVQSILPELVKEDRASDLSELSEDTSGRPQDDVVDQFDAPIQ